jgi:hypothetical protein
MKIQFEDGLIQNIQLNGKITGTQENISFTNPYPIGFSAKSDMTRLLETYWLVDASHQFCLNVSELIRYGINLRNQTMDYSPADQVLSITSHEVNKPMPVLKEQNQELFDAKIYTDFIGFAKNKPNGLVQIEIGRQTNLWTRNFNAAFYNTRKLKPCSQVWPSIGYLHYIYPYFNISKKTRRITKRNVR